MRKFDIVICVGPHDEHIINDQLLYTKKNVIGYRNIYLVVHAASKLDHIEGTTIINETIFPFAQELSNHPSWRSYWYLQQLIKLYAWKMIPDLLPQYLVLDADTFFLRPTTFICPHTDRAMLSTLHTQHQEYFNHMSRLHPSLKRSTSLSGIVNHMLFETKFLKCIFDLVEPKEQFWRVFLDVIPPEQFDGSAASEYEIYFQYVVANFPNEIIIRDLSFRDVQEVNDTYANYCDFVSCHWYQRTQK